MDWSQVNWRTTGYRVKSVVRAVDVIAWKNKIDPATLTPLEPEPEPVPVK